MRGSWGSNSVVAGLTLPESWQSIRMATSGSATTSSPAIKPTGTFGMATCRNLRQTVHIFVDNFVGQSISELCGVRTQTCPPGMKTGDPISPPGGFVGGGMLQLTDIAIDPAGNVWVADNWRDYDNHCFVKPAEAISTQCGGNGLTVFYGMAKPVRTPQIGPPLEP